MKTFIYSTLTIILLGFSVFAQSPPAVSQSKTVENILRVETENGKILELKTTDLAKLPRREVKARDHDGKETIYEGVDLREILQLAGIKFDKESGRLNLTRYLLIEAADKYRVVFAFAEIDQAFTDKTILLAEKATVNCCLKKTGIGKSLCRMRKSTGVGFVRLLNLQSERLIIKLPQALELN